MWGKRPDKSANGGKLVPHRPAEQNRTWIRLPARVAAATGHGFGFPGGNTGTKSANLDRLTHAITYGTAPFSWQANSLAAAITTASQRPTPVRYNHVHGAVEPEATAHEPASHANPGIEERPPDPAKGRGAQKGTQEPLFCAPLISLRAHTRQHARNSVRVKHQRGDRVLQHAQTESVRFKQQREDRARQHAQGESVRFKNQREKRPAWTHASVTSKTQCTARRQREKLCAWTRASALQSPAGRTRIRGRVAAYCRGGDE